MLTVTAKLKYRDESVHKEITIPGGFYVAPMILVDGNDYYIRTSADAIHDPLEFVIVNSVYVVP